MTDHGDNPSRHSAGGGDSSGPSRFDIVLRGYDRRQVEDHITGLERTISRQRSELEQARGASGSWAGSGATNGSHQDASAGGRQGGGSLFGGGSGSGSREGAGLTPEMIGSFTSRLQSILQAAEEEAEEVRSNARAFAHAEEQAGRARLEELERRRQSVLSELSRVRTQLDGLLGQTDVGSAAGSSAMGSPAAPAPSSPGSPAPSSASAPTVAAAPVAGPSASSGTERTLLNPAPPPAAEKSGEGARPAGPVGTPAYPLPNRAAATPSTPATPASRPATPPTASGDANKPRPTPSPRPRPGPPSSNLPGKDISAGPAEQGSRNGSGTRGDDDGRSAFGSGAR